MQETMNNELLSTLEMLIDKFNLTLEVSSEQIKEFGSTMATKIVHWELIESFLIIAILLILAVVIRKLDKKYINDSFQNLINLCKTSEINREYDKLVAKLLIKVVTFICYVVFIGNIIKNIVDIILCLTFPEKIILEFIGSYIK